MQFEFVEGTTLDAGNVIFATDDPAILTFNAMQRKFASVPGAKIEHGALDTKGKEIPLTPLTIERIDRPKESSKITPFIYTNVIALSVDEKTVSRGKNIKIRYVIESSEDASDKIWLGASVLTDKKTGEYFSNTDQDKYISLVKGRHEYDRDLRIPMNAPLGVHLLRANLWHVIAEGKSMIIARGTPIEIEIVA